jgi:hypothetical protein
MPTPEGLAALSLDEAPLAARQSQFRGGRLICTSTVFFWSEA